METTDTTSTSSSDLSWKSRVKGALWKSAGLLLTLGIIFESLRNTLTWYATKIWGGAGDTWQEMWTFFLEKVGGEDEWMLFVFGSAFVANLTFFGLGSLYAWFDYSDIPWIKKYKIQPGANEPVPDRKKFVKLVRGVVFNQTVVLIPYLCVIHRLTEWRQAYAPPLFAKNNYDLRTLPEFHWVLIEFAVFLLVEEVAFFYSHRLAHHRRFYKYVHKVHHEWTAPVGLTALYAHPLEHVVSNMLPVSLGPLVCGSHLATAWLWTTIAIATTINSHGGYHFPFFPSPEAHDFHHLKFNQCFGVLGILDYLHGTDSMFKSSKAYQRHVMLVTTTPMRELIPDDENVKRKELDNDIQ